MNPIGAQYELYTTSKVDELMENEVFAFAARQFKDQGLLFDSIAPKIRDNKSMVKNATEATSFTERMQTLSQTEKDILNSLYQLYYFGKTPAMSMDYEQIKQLYKKLIARGEFHSSTSLTGYGISQAELLTAIADVIVERAKQELARTYFDKWAEKISKGIPIWYSASGLSFRIDSSGSPDTIQLEMILPNTYSFLKNSAKHMTPEMGQTFKNAFTKDLEVLFPNFIEYGLPARYKMDNSVDDYALGSYHFVRKLVSNSDFYTASDEMLTALEQGSPDAGDIKDVLQFVRVLNTSLVDPDGKYIVNSAAFRNSGTASFKLYLHLLSQNKSVPDSIRPVLVSRGNRALFNQLIADMSRVQLTLRSISDAKESTQKITSVNLAVVSFTEAITTTIGIYEGCVGARPSVVNAFSENMHYVKIGSEFVTSMYTRNFSNSALMVLQFIKLTYKGEMNADLFKYITLISDVSHAQNGNEVRTIIESAILPVGSYAIKRTTRMSVSVNAYAGLGGGLEWSKIDNHNTYQGASLGFALPIGVALNWSAGDEDNKASSNSIFVSLIDLGAIAYYNLGQGDDTDDDISISTSPDITFANVLSPGMAYIRGCKSSPISFLLGLQYMPRLREITGATNNVIGTADAIQLKLGILVDVPLFSLMMKHQK
jgi:hypothetical protein